MIHAEHLIISHLTETDSLDILSKEGFDTEDVRQVLSAQVSRSIMKWGLNLYFESGRKVPITKTMILETWGEEVEKAGLEINDTTELEPVEWAIDKLRETYAQTQLQDLLLEIAKDFKSASGPDKVGTLVQSSNKMIALVRTLASRRVEFDAANGVDMAIQRYLQRQIEDLDVRGLTFGLDEIDQYTKGVEEGELAVFVAGSGVGKSWIALKTLLAGWTRGKKGILYTLENSIDMTADRLVCMGAGVPYELWQSGACTPTQFQRVTELKQELEDSECKPLITMPPRGERTATSLVRRAISEGYDFLVIDQLSFVDPPAGFERHKSVRNSYSEVVKELKAEISENKHKIPCLLLHQINREGSKDLAKDGKYTFNNIAESSDIERTADFMFAVYQTDRHRRDGIAVWQTMKGRRVNGVKSWGLIWDLSHGYIAIEHEITE